MQEIQNLLNPEYLPFTIALLIVGGIGAIEALGAGLVSVDLDIPDPDDGGVLDWLGIGEVPMIIVLVAFLTLFAAGGIGLQSAVFSIQGSFLPTWLAVGFVAVVSVIFTGVFSRLLARVMPRDETDAISPDALLWRRATIVTGTAYANHPARARVRDSLGTTHYVMVEPADEVTRMYEGDEVVLSRREGEKFYALATESELRIVN